MNRISIKSMNLMSIVKGCNYLFSGIIDIDSHSLKARRGQFLGHALNSLKLDPLSYRWTKFESRVTKNFGNYEMGLLEGVINTLDREKRFCKSEIDFIINKCAKDTSFLYSVDRMIKDNTTIKRSSLIQLICIFNDNIEQLESLLNDPRQFISISPNKKKDYLKVMLENISALNLHKKLSKSRGPVSQNQDNFYSFLSFLIFRNLNVFFSLDSTIQYKIQNLFFNSGLNINSVSDLIKNNDFLSLSTKAQFSFLNHLKKDCDKLNSLLELIADKEFKALSQAAQEGVFNIMKLTPWKTMKANFSGQKLEGLLKAFQNSSIECPKNRSLFECMLKLNNFDGLVELVKQDRIETFQKEVLSNALVLLSELKKTNLKTTHSDTKADSAPYTLTESQMKLHLGNKFQERSNFQDDRSWLKANIDTFVSKIWSRFDSAVFVVLSYVLLITLVIISGNLGLFLFFMSIFALHIASIIAFEIVICFPIPFPFFIEQRFGALEKELLNIVLNEGNYPDAMSLYHAAKGDRGAFYEMYTQLRHDLSMTTRKSDNEITILRAFDNAFDEGLSVDKFKNDVENRWEKTYQLSYYDEYEYYASRAISTNTGLLGNIGDSGECTLAYWQNNFSINKVDHNLILGNLISRIWGETVKKDEINARAKAYNNLIQKIGSLSGGTLLQLLINKDDIDDIAFVCEAGGIPLNIQLDGETEKTDKASKLLTLQRSNPGDYEKILRKNWRNFKKMRHLYLNYFNFFDTQQARVIAHPSFLSNSKKATIFKYDAAIPSSDDSAETVQKRKQLGQLRKQLKDMIREDVMRSVANGVKLDAGSIAGNKGEQPIQRYFRYVMQGVLNEEVEYKTNVQKTLEARENSLNKVLKAQNAGEFQQAMVKLAQSEQFPGKWAAKNDVHAKHKDSKVRKLLMTQDLEPKDIIEILQGYPELDRLLQRDYIWFVSAQSHAITLLESFKTQNVFFPLSEELTKMMVSIVIPFTAIAQTKKKNERNGFIIPLMVNYMAKMGFKKDEILLATSLVTCDILENYIFIANDKLQQSRAKTEEVLQLNASQCGIPNDVYFAMQYLLHITQATSGPAAKFYKAAPEFGGLHLPESQPDLKEWIDELFQI